MARIADAVVVGSRIVNEIETSPEGEVVNRVKTLVDDLRRGVDAAENKIGLHEKDLTGGKP